MQSESDYKKINWHSRRGMLELDLILIPFSENYIRKLSSEELSQFESLLLEEDQDLYSWLIGKTEPENNNLKNIVSIIKRVKITQ